ncbi:MAG: putative toxin-antitoxin system toxin component, PIN family [Bacteroidia bacterium]|nr:putative toxin-antitoxin system toxin component, PIN family [Bacteroidia bacterium]
MENNVFAVIDTNVLVSALLSKDLNANTIQVIKAIIDMRITPIYNDEIFQEYEDVLSRDKFHFTEENIINFLSIFKSNGINVNRTKVEEEIFPDPKDIVFYEVAMSKEDAFLVTGNIKHFPTKPFVVTPAQMMAILNQ